MAGPIVNSTFVAQCMLGVPPVGPVISILPTVMVGGAPVATVASLMFTPKFCNVTLGPCALVKPPPNFIIADFSLIIQGSPVIDMTTQIICPVGGPCIQFVGASNVMNIP